MAYANTGIPVLVLAWPIQWLILLPVVGIEAVLLARALSMSIRQTLFPTLKANVLSTLVGMPMAGVSMLLLEWCVLALNSMQWWPSALQTRLFHIVSLLWLGSGHTLAYVAFLMFLMPFCWISVLIERAYLRSFFQTITKEALSKAVTKGNIASYGMLGALVVFQMLDT